MTKKRKALLLGATGFVGGHLLHLLEKEDTWSTVILPVRKQKDFSVAKAHVEVVDFDRLKDHAGVFDVDDVFCCLGTTMKKAGSRDAFYRVDYEYVIEAARLAREKGAERFFVVTALGADAGSKIFYNRVKGEVEASLEALGFSALHIFRPSLLTGEREEKRLGEDLGKFLYRLLSFIFIGPLKQYRAIEGEVVAQAMILAALSQEKGVIVHESSRMQQALYKNQ